MRPPATHWNWPLPATAGTIGGLGSGFIGFGWVTVDTSASWDLTGANTLASGQTLTNAGTLTLSDAALTDAGALVNNGQILLDPSTLTAASLSGTGIVTVGNDATLIAQGRVYAGETIDFADGTGTLQLAPGSFSGAIDLLAGDRLLLTGIANATTAEVVNSNTLRVDLANDSTIDLKLSRTFTNETFHVATVNNNAEITALCFCAGTRIATPSGEVPVAAPCDRRPGADRRDGAPPVTWIGVGRVLATRGRRNAATPVIVRRGALADNVPQRDLHVTKGHSLYLDGVLIPVEFLVNHRSILWDDQAQRGATLPHRIGAATTCCWPTARRRRAIATTATAGCSRMPTAAGTTRQNRLCAGADRRRRWSMRRGGGCWTAAAGARDCRLTDDPDLHLLADGRRIDRQFHDSTTHIFRLPTRRDEIRVMLAQRVPQELGLARDDRALGVALRRIILRSGARLQVIEAARPALDGRFLSLRTDG